MQRLRKVDRLPGGVAPGHKGIRREDVFGTVLDAEPVDKLFARQVVRYAARPVAGGLLRRDGCVSGEWLRSDSCLLRSGGSLCCGGAPPLSGSVPAGSCAAAPVHTDAASRVSMPRTIRLPYPLFLLLRCSIVSVLCPFRGRKVGIFGLIPRCRPQKTGGRARSTRKFTLSCGATREVSGQSP